MCCKNKFDLIRTNPDQRDQHCLILGPGAATHDNIGISAESLHQREFPGMYGGFRNPVETCVPCNRDVFKTQRLNQPARGFILNKKPMNVFKLRPEPAAIPLEK